MLHIVNAGESSFPEAWPGYQGCASYNLNPNGSGWFRVPTEYNESNGVLTFRLTPEKVGFTAQDRGFVPEMSFESNVIVLKPIYAGLRLFRLFCAIFLRATPSADSRDAVPAF